MAKPNEKPAGEPRLLARAARHRLVDVSRKPPPIAVADVMTALGGRPLGIRPGDDKAPVALLTIRRGLAGHRGHRQPRRDRPPQGVSGAGCQRADTLGAGTHPARPDQGVGGGWFRGLAGQPVNRRGRLHLDRHAKLTPVGLSSAESIGGGDVRDCSFMSPVRRARRTMDGGCMDS